MAGIHDKEKYVGLVPFRAESEAGESGVGARS